MRKEGEQSFLLSKIFHLLLQTRLQKVKGAKRKSEKYPYLKTIFISPRFPFS